MTLIEKMVAKGKQFGLNGEGLATAKPDLTSQLLSCSPAEAENLISACRRVMTKASDTAQIKPWPDEYWNFFAAEVAKEYNTPAPAANPFGSAVPAPAQVAVQQPSNGQSSELQVFDASELKQTVIGHCRLLKSDRKNADLFDGISLNGRFFDDLVTAAIKRFDDREPTETQIEKLIRDEIEANSAYRDAWTDFRAAAESWGLEIAPNPKGGPDTESDKEKGIIGNVAVKAIVTMIQHDKMTAEQALKALRFSPRGRKPVTTTPAPAANPFGSAPTAPANPFGSAG